MWREKSADYYEGLREGIRRFAYWKDGTQYVGTTGKRLDQAIQETMNEQMRFTLEK